MLPFLNLQSDSKGSKSVKRESGEEGEPAIEAPLTLVEDVMSIFYGDWMQKQLETQTVEYLVTATSALDVIEYIESLCKSSKIFCEDKDRMYLRFILLMGPEIDLEGFNDKSKSYFTNDARSHGNNIASDARFEEYTYEDVALFVDNPEAEWFYPTRLLRPFQIPWRSFKDVFFKLAKEIVAMPVHSRKAFLQEHERGTPETTVPRLRRWFWEFESRDEVLPDTDIFSFARLKRRLQASYVFSKLPYIYESGWPQDLTAIPIRSAFDQNTGDNDFIWIPNVMDRDIKRLRPPDLFMSNLGKVNTSELILALQDEIPWPGEVWQLVYPTPLQFFRGRFDEKAPELVLHPTWVDTCRRYFAAGGHPQDKVKLFDEQDSVLREGSVSNRRLTLPLADLINKGNSNREQFDQIQMFEYLKVMIDFGFDVVNYANHLQFMVFSADYTSFSDMGNVIFSDDMFRASGFYVLRALLDANRLFDDTTLAMRTRLLQYAQIHFLDLYSREKIDPPTRFENKSSFDIVLDFLSICAATAGGGRGEVDALVELKMVLGVAAQGFRIGLLHRMLFPAFAQFDNFPKSGSARELIRKAANFTKGTFNNLQKSATIEQFETLLQLLTVRKYLHFDQYGKVTSRPCHGVQGASTELALNSVVNRLWTTKESYHERALEFPYLSTAPTVRLLTVVVLSRRLDFVRSVLKFGGEDLNLGLNRDYLARVITFMRQCAYSDQDTSKIDSLNTYLTKKRYEELPSASVMIAVALNELHILKALVTRRHGIDAALAYAKEEESTQLDIRYFLQEQLRTPLPF